jgi:TP901 family phage tail tape measure protein
LANVNANVNVLITTQQAQAQIAALQGKINAFNKSVVASSGAAVAQQAAMNKALMDGAVASKMFTARMVPVTTSVESFTTSLEKNKLSLGQYTKYAASQLPGMSRVFRKEFDTINRVAESNVRRLQTQFTAAGTAANGMNRAIALTPTSLNGMAASQAIANQRAMIFNKLMRDGSTSLLNWGKNTQWAGRQLMVGFTIPLTIFAGVAAKTFKDIEAQAINFRKVYGDIFTTETEVEKNLAAVKELSLELTKYGIAVKDTMELASIAAQSGLRSADLMAATTQATRLAVLGQMEQAEAMQTVISMQTAFQQSNEDLAESVDFLNIIENQTVLSLQDVAGAIPRVAPVIQGLGGDVKDLAVLLVAMREGGVSAAEGANALKNSLGRLIDPTKKAREMAEKFGISLDGIVIRNKGEVLPMIRELAKELQGLDGLEQQQLLSAIFGKFQYARIGALMKNIADDSSQAARAMALTGMSAEELARTAEQELAVVENAVSTKFTAAMERAKVAIAPVGEQFLKALTPIFNFISDLFEKFNNLPDGIKNAIAVVIGIIGGIAPVALMVIGLIGNLMANGIKFINVLRGLFARLSGTSGQFQYMAIAEQEAALASASLEGKVTSLTGKLLLQQEALATIIRLYGQMAGAATSAAAAMPLGFAGPRVPKGGGTSPFSMVNAPAPSFKGFNKGIVKVPGKGNKDTVPAFLTPGESIVTKEATQKYGPMLQAMNAGSIPGFAEGAINVAGASSGITMQLFRSASAQTISRMADRVVQELVQDGISISTALDRVTKVLNDFAETGQRLSTKTARQLFQEQGLTRSSRTLVAAHLTEPMSYSDPRTQAAIAQQSAAFQEFARANPDYVRATSKLTALLPSILNQQMAPGRSGATFRDFRAGWKLGGKETLFNAAEMTDDTIRGDAEAGKALKKMAGDIGRRSVAIAKAAGSQRVKDEHLVVATQQVIDKYKAVGGSATRAATALERAANQVGQLRVNVPGSVVRQGLATGQFIQRGDSVVTRSGVEVARNAGSRPAGNIPVAGGLATATASQQAQALTRVMGASGPVVAAAYYATNAPAMVAGTARTAQQMAQTQNQVLENNTQDIALIARDRNSPHPIVAQDAIQDARSYARNIRQTLMSMAPIKIPGGMVQSAPIDPRAQYRASQSAIRREAFNIREMERIGMTDTQILRQLRRLEESKKRQLAAQQKNVQLAQSNANLTQKTSESLSREQQQQTRRLTAQQNSEQVRAAILGTSDTTRRTIGQRAKGFFVGGTDEMGRTRGQRLAGMGNTATMGLMGLSMAASFAGGAIGEMAQKIMPVTMGLFALQMMLPMLKSPLGLLIILAGGLAAGFIYLRKQVDDAAKAAAQAGANLGGMANSMKIIEEATGFAVPKYEERLFRFTDEDREAMSEFKEYFQSEAGSKFIEELKAASSEERYERVRYLLAQGIASGLDEEKAKAFGKAIAEATGDTLLNSSIARDFANQFFKSGSQGLIDLERERMKTMPNLSSEIINIEGGRFGAWQRTIAKEMEDSSQNDNAFVAYIKRVLNIVNVFKTASEVIGAQSEKMETIAISAKGLGFALQTIQNLANAEAVLEEERRTGVIKYEEYARRLGEINQLQQESADYIGQVFDMNADQGAMMQALGDQLSFAGFGEDQIKRIQDRFSPDALAKQFFGEDKDFSSLDKEQQDYVEQVFTRIMSGLTPENISQRLNDVEGTYTNIANDFANAVQNGLLGGLDLWFSRENISSFIEERMGGGIAGTRRRGGGYVSPDQLAENIMGADQELKRMGTDSVEVFQELTKFIDQDFAKSIMSSKEDILKFGKALAALKDYSKINIELFFKKYGDDFDPEALKSELEKMGDTKLVFDPEIVGGKRAAKSLREFFGSALPDPQEYANMLGAMGVATDEFFSRYQQEAIKVGQTLLAMPDALNEKTGRIKPKMLVQVLTSLFGNTLKDPQGAADALNAAFPESLSPIQLMIMVGLGGEGVGFLARMQTDPKFKEAIMGAKPGEDVTIPGKFIPMSGTTAPETIGAGTVAGLQAIYTTPTGGFNIPPPKEPEKTGGSGGGDKKDPIQELMDGIMDTVNKFTNLTKLITGKYKNAKNALEKALNDPNFGFSGGLVDKMRKAGLNEKLIADILSKGAAEAAKIWENFSKVTKKGVTVLTKAGKQANILSAAGGISQEVDKLQAKARADRGRVTLSKWMEGQGFSKEEIKEILSSTDDALITQMLVLGKNSKMWREWIKAQKDAKKAGEDFNGTANATTKALEDQSKVMDVVNADFAKQEADLRFDRYQEFAEIHGKTADEMEREIANNERLIDGHKQRIAEIEKEIRVIERRRSDSADYNEWGLEQLQREIELNNQAIRALERRNELDQRRIDALRREDDIRNRVADALNYELEIMSQQETKINEAYEERFKALDKVSKINDHLIDQQRQQLGLSQAISEGDIYAATAAAQEMRASSAQFARDQLRTGLETARDNQIENLRTEGGLTRDQAEERIRQIKEQSYQTSLKIRDIEDAIYERNLNEILPLKDKQFNLESAIQKVNAEIYEKQQLILQIERDKIEPLQEANDKMATTLKHHNDITEELIEQQAVNGLTRKEWDLLNDKIVAALEYSESLTSETEGARKSALALAKQWKVVAKNIDNAFKAAEGEFRDIEARDVGPGYTEAQRQADLAAARTRRDERIAAILSGAPSVSFNSSNKTTKVPGQVARAHPMPGGKYTIGEAFDLGIVALNDRGRLYWTNTGKLVDDVPKRDLSAYAMGGKVKGYGKGGKMLRYPMGGLIPYALGGMVFGDGARDSVLAKLTPGEYVIRKAMVDKYGIPMLEALNQGAFSLPKYNVEDATPTEVKASVNTANINAPVYNTYDMKFAVSGTNASADEIANKVMFKMKQVQNQGIRSNRAY